MKSWTILSRVPDMPGTLQLPVREGESGSWVAHSRVQGLCGLGPPLSYPCPTILYKTFNFPGTRVCALQRDCPSGMKGHVH